MRELPSTLSAVGLFVVLSYTLTFGLFMLWWVVLKRSGEKLSSLADSAAFNAVMTSFMFMPLLSLCLLSLTYGQLEVFAGFVFTWLKIDLKSLILFLLAPIPPIVALVLYMEVTSVMGMIEANALKQIAGLERFASVKTLKILGMGYAAGVTVNALLALGEEFGWRAYLMPSLTRHVEILGSVIIVGIVWGLWHVPVILSAKPLLERYFPWMTLELVLVSNVVSCIVLSYPLYFLLISSGSVLPPAAFHGTVNALWQIPQFVTRVSSKHRYRDLAKIALTSVLAWSIAIIVTLTIGESCSNLIP